MPQTLEEVRTAIAAQGGIMGCDPDLLLLLTYLKREE